MSWTLLFGMGLSLRRLMVQCAGSGIALLGCHAVSSVDTAACPASSASWDDCCWEGREASPDARRVAEVGDLKSWTGEDEGITVIRSAAELAVWWTAVGEGGSTDVDFGSEVAVGFIGLSSTECDEYTLDGLKAGDLPGEWFAGVKRVSWCGVYDSGGCPDYVAHATLYAAPMGRVTECSVGQFCEG